MAILAEQSRLTIAALIYKICFPEERHHVMSKAAQKVTEKRLNQLYNQVYRENYSIILAFQRENIAIPQELQVAAQVALSHRVREVISWLGKNQ